TEVQIINCTVDTGSPNVKGALMRLKDNTFVFVGNNNGGADGKLMVGTISGTTITAGTAVTATYFKPYKSGAGGLLRVSNTKFILLGYRYSANTRIETWEVTNTTPAMLATTLDLTTFGSSSSGQDM